MVEPAWLLKYHPGLIFKAFDVGAAAGELVLEGFVAAVEVVDAVDDGLAAGGEAGDDEGDGGAEVGGHDRGAGEGVDAADDGGGAVDVDAGAHAVEFGDVHEAVFEDGFGDHGRTFGNRHDGHELGLHVRREAGEGFGHHIGAAQAVAALDTDAVGEFGDFDAGVIEGAAEGGDVVEVGAVEFEVAAADGGGAGVGAGFDAVGDDAVGGGVEGFDSLDGEAVGAEAGDLGAHGVEAGGEVGDFGFAGGVGDGGGAVGEGGGHQEVFGGADGGEWQDNGGAVEAAADGGVHVAAFEQDFGAHLLEALEVEVDRAGADGAAAGEGDLGFAAAGEEGAEDQDGGAHLADDVVGRLGVGDRAAEAEGAVAGGFGGDAVAGEQGGHGFDVGEFGDVGQAEAFLGEEAGGEQREGGVFGAADGEHAVEWASAANSDPVH